MITLNGLKKGVAHLSFFVVSVRTHEVAMMWHIVGIVQVDIKKDGAAEWGE